MDAPNDPEPREQPPQAERKRPTPNADRRRKFQNEDIENAAPTVFTDWASI